MHCWKRKKVSDYNTRLREKQKLKRTYGVLEAQFRRTYREADRKKGNTGTNLLMLLERRLDNVVYRLGFAPSRASARQMINHGHVQVNERKVDIASFTVRKNDVIKAMAKQKSENLFKECYDEIQGANKPTWLQVVEKPMHGVMIESPTREEIAVPINEQLIVEICSK